MGSGTWLPYTPAYFVYPLNERWWWPIFCLIPLTASLGTSFFSRKLYDWEAQSATSLFHSLQSIFLSRRAPDNLVWLLESFGKFISKSFFNAISNSSSIEPSFPRRKIWNPVVPLGVKAFSWTVILCRINTMDMLQRRRPFMLLSPHWCALCHLDGGSVHHIFLHCSFTHKVWIYFISRMGCYWVMPEKLYLMFSSWKSFGASVRPTKFGDSLLHAILWGIW